MDEGGEVFTDSKVWGQVWQGGMESWQGHLQTLTVWARGHEGSILKLGDVGCMLGTAVLIQGSRAEEGGGQLFQMMQLVST